MTPKLKESIIVLKRINNQLNNVKDALLYAFEKKIDAYNSTWNEDEIFKINTCVFALTNYSFIWYTSFLDEFNKYFKSSDQNEQNEILKIKKNSKKYTKNIKEIFGDIKTARNLVLAHGYRNGDRILTNEEINKYFNQLSNFDSHTPFLQISNITSIIIKEIEKVFGEISEAEISL